MGSQKTSEVDSPELEVYMRVSQSRDIPGIPGICGDYKGILGVLTDTFIPLNRKMKRWLGIWGLERKALRSRLTIGEGLRGGGMHGRIVACDHRTDSLYNRHNLPQAPAYAPNAPPENLTCYTQGRERQYPHPGNLRICKR